MLQILFHIIIISVVCIIWGLPVFLIANKKNQQKFISPAESFLFLFFSGLILLSVVSSWLVLFLPLQFGYLLTLTIILLVSTCTTHTKKCRDFFLNLLKLRLRITATNLMLLISGVMLFLALGVAKSVHIDTQMYHLQVIRWTNEYGTVPGLANIYPRLGLGSAWFNLISFFHFPFFKNQNFTYLNCTFVLWFFLWLLYKFVLAGRSEKKNVSLRLFYISLIIYFFFDWQLFRDTANSTSYDFIVTALIIICISFVLERIFNDSTSELYIPAFTILALTILSFKLSGAFILILLFWKLYESKKTSSWVFAFLMGILILLPVLMRNYITTGYPLYPLEFSFGNPGWKLPTELTLGIKDHIIFHNRYYDTTHLGKPGNDFFSLNWIPFWFKGILIQHKIICIASLLSIIFLFIKVDEPVKAKKIRILLIVLLSMSLGWFITVPDPRFGYGFLLCLAFLPASLLFGKYISSFTCNIIQWILIACIGIYLFKKSVYIINDPGYLIQTAQTLQPPYSIVRNDSLSFNYPEKVNSNWNNRCFFTPLPCLCEKNPYVRFRGKSLKNGFFMLPVTDSMFIKKYNY